VHPSAFAASRCAPGPPFPAWAEPRPGTAPQGPVCWTTAFVCCPPCVAFCLRKRLREEKAFKGSDKLDAAVVACCCPCAMCQMRDYVDKASPNSVFAKPAADMAR
jgi:hypothetical protein